MSEEPDKSGTELVTSGSLTALVRKPQESLAAHPALVMIHGWGANEGDIYELVPFVDRRVLVVAPRGPHLASDDPRGSFFWYEREAAYKGQDAKLEESLDRLGRLLDELEQVGGVAVDPTQIYVGGFSQGGAMSLAMATRYPERLAGILPHSAIALPSVAEKLRAGAFRGKDAFVVHGTLDVVLQINKGREVKEVLEEGGVNLTYKEYPVGHATSPESRQDLADWLNGRLRF